MLALQANLNYYSAMDKQAYHMGCILAFRKFAGASSTAVELAWWRKLYRQFQIAKEQLQIAKEQFFPGPPRFTTAKLDLLRETLEADDTT
jgi:hypothetical protein